jgi:hypothetical protein
MCYNPGFTMRHVLQFRQSFYEWFDIAATPRERATAWAIIVGCVIGLVGLSIPWGMAIAMAIALDRIAYIIAQD